MPASCDRPKADAGGRAFIAQQPDCAVNSGKQGMGAFFAEFTCGSDARLYHMLNLAKAVLDLFLAGRGLRRSVVR